MRTISASSLGGSSPALARNSARPGLRPSSHSRWKTSAGLSPFLRSNSRIAVFQAELLDHALDGTGQLHAAGLGLAAHLFGNLRPRQPVSAQIGQLRLFFAQAATHLFQ